MLKEAWEEAGFVYMCSEYCELGNLNDYISKSEKTWFELSEGKLEDLTI
jgi:hypothetical protein